MDLGCNTEKQRKFETREGTDSKEENKQKRSRKDTTGMKAHLFLFSSPMFSPSSIWYVFQLISSGQREKKSLSKPSFTERCSLE